MEGEFKTHKYAIPIERMGETHTLVPFGDIHFGAPLHADDVFDEFIWESTAQDNAPWQQNQPSKHFLGMGDYFDLLSGSERKAIKSANLHETTNATLDSMYRSLADLFVKKLEPLRGRIIGLLEGNHHAELQSGMTTTQYLCEQLDCPYLGTAAFIRIVFDHKGSQTCVDVIAHHGKGAARLVGGSLNRVQQLAEIWEADVYLMGHDHKRSLASWDRMCLDRNMKVRTRHMIFARTGTYLKGWDPNHPSYVVENAMGGTNLGGVKISLTPQRDRKENGRGLHVRLEATI